MTEPLPVPDPDLAKPVVLVAEDEVLVRMLIADLVQDAGFRVIEAADAREALRVLQARPDVHVLVTDVEMPPGPSGLDLSRCARTGQRMRAVIPSFGLI